ncbi:hypothetical protein GOP47_0015628 [Adiantum capillus-veneris]|uniref:TFIIS N-terminal domain-containing protein n=1 Tax=Adiantum capillus-veneris TaxID=13818 RepID=A0A9D4UKT5_ADICA|nr:hypothetical protein GOP47_0015628 [Adiantum capillus-veneris]
MERWRSFFAKSKADIWTLIQQAITVAAADYPQDFRARRDQIAETLFDRSLLRQHVTDDPCLIYEVRGTGPAHMLKAPINAGDTGRPLHDDAEALSDELEEEALILRDLHCIKATLVDVDQPENVILEALQRLQYIQISVDNLKATEIGKHVRNLKRHSSQRVKAIAKELMRQWKLLVDEWMISVKDVTATAATTISRTDCAVDGNDGAGLLEPPLDEGALLDTGVPDVDLSQLFNFVDGEDFCTEIGASLIPPNSMEASVKDNLSHLCRSQSGSMLTECNELDIKVSTGHSWGLTTPEDRGSAIHDKYPPSNKAGREEAGLKRQATSNCGKTQTDDGQPLLKIIANGSGPGRPCNDDDGLPSKTIANGSGSGRPCNEISTAKPVSADVARAKALNNGSSMRQSNDLPSRLTKNACARAKPTADAKSLDQIKICNVDESRVMSSKNQTDKRLEIAKRKLHEGYQQAENAKKQRTVQILTSSDLPFSSQAGKTRMSTNVHNKDIISGHEGRAKVNSRVHGKDKVGAKMNAPIHKKACIKSGQGSQLHRKFS